MMTTFHEETLVRRLCVGANTARRYNEEGRAVPKTNPLNAIRKPYIYGSSKPSLRPAVPYSRKDNL